MRFIIVETSDTQFQFDNLDSAMDWIGTLCKNRVRFTVKHSNGAECAEEKELKRAEEKYKRHLAYVQRKKSAA
jgi:hypothetical protein